MVRISLVSTWDQFDGGMNEKKPVHNDGLFEFLVGRAGFEPATKGLKVLCSTN